MVHIYDMDLVKESSPPLLTVTGSEWEEVSPPPSVEEDRGLLPASGLPLVLVSVVAALMYGMRRD